MKLLEKQFQNEVIKYLQNNKIWYKRTQMGFESGTPDIICIYKGLFVGLELKRPDGKGKATKQQEKVKKDIEDSKGIVLIVNNLSDIISLFKTIDWFLYDIEDQRSAMRRCVGNNY